MKKRKERCTRLKRQEVIAKSRQVQSKINSQLRRSKGTTCRPQSHNAPSTCTAACMANAAEQKRQEVICSIQGRRGRRHVQGGQEQLSGQRVRCKHRQERPAPLPTGRPPDEFAFCMSKIQRGRKYTNTTQNTLPTKNSANAIWRCLACHDGAHALWLLFLLLPETCTSAGERKKERKKREKKTKRRPWLKSLGQKPTRTIETDDDKEIAKKGSKARGGRTGEEEKRQNTFNTRFWFQL